MDLIKILLADEEKLFREILQSGLGCRPNLQILGSTATGPETIEKARILKPDLVILNVKLPFLNGIQVCRTILEQNSRIKVLALSMQQDPQSVQEMFRAGAHGYLLKTCDFSELLQAIETVHSDHSYLSPPIMDMMLDSLLFTTNSTVPEDLEIPDPNSGHSLLPAEFYPAYPPPVWS